MMSVVLIRKKFLLDVVVVLMSFSLPSAWLDVT